MESSKLWELLQSMDARERGRLGKFVRSPFFNQRDDVIRLLEVLEESVRRAIPPTDKQVLFQSLFPGAPYDDHRVRLAASLLLKLAEKFMVYEYREGQPVDYELQLAGIYRRRNLQRHYRGAIRQALAQQEKEPYQNAEFFEHSFRIELEEYNHAAASWRTDATNLQGVSDQFDLAYIAQKLRQSCFSLSHQAVYNTEYRFGLLEEVLAYIDRAELQDIPAIGVYYYCYLALVHPETEVHFQQFRRKISESDHVFPQEEIRNLYLLAINYCIKKYNEGNSHYLEEENQLYRQGLEKGYLLINGYLSRFTYRNVVTIGLVMKDFEWVEQFIHQYRDTLKPDIRDSIFSFCLANLEYEKKNYDAAIHLLQKSEYRDLLLNLAAKTLQMKVWYELGELDVLDSHLEAMRTFIRRKGIIGYHRSNYLNTITITKKLVNLRPYDQAQREALRRQIEQTMALAEREWLLGQLE
ncbi:MAG: hypothetical protein IPJ40_13000 [Saprospirales bacterium]|nr:hypothetical protein [Saprospirales bacterium]